MSGNVFAEDVQAAKQAGMNAHIGKPVDIDAICKVLHELLK
jgi:CheY-like chemotaxis protein